MYPAAFEYARAESLDHALELLSEHGDEARPLAGGMSLIPLMKLRLAQPGWIVDIGRLPGLDGVRQDGQAVRLGGLVRHVDVVDSDTVRERLPLLHDAVGVIGDVQLRNVGTVGGAIAEADPAGDWGPALLALGGRVVARGGGGQRSLGAEELFVDAYTTCLAPDELITGVEIPVPDGRSGGAYLKLERRAGDFAVCSAAVQLTLDGEGVCAAAGVGLGAAGLTPLKASGAEGVLRGNRPEPDVVAEAAREVERQAEPVADVRGSPEYKRAVLKVVFRRAVDAAVRRANGETVEAGHV